jgi:hypothetical protein
MNARWLLISAATIAAFVAALCHRQTARVQSQLEKDTQHLRSEIAEARRWSGQAERDIVTLRAELQALTAARSAPPSSAVVRSPAAVAPAAPAAKPAVVPLDPELRQLQVQAFVAAQRLRFGALLKRLGFGPEELQAFERIQNEYRQATIDDAVTEGERQQAVQLRNARLKELLGPGYDQWVEANRVHPARVVVEQIVQQTFQSSGALTSVQADELTRIVGAHRSQEGRGQVRYDWDNIIADAGRILNAPQTEAFTAAIQFRRATEKMTAMAASKKPE